MNLNSAEIETIGLCISLEAIDEVVNHALLDIRTSSKNPENAEVYFKDSIHRSLFLIRFLDFSGESGDSKLTGVTGSCIKVLKHACENKNFNIHDSVGELDVALKNLDDWLNFKLPLKLWLPTLDLEATINVSRFDFLYIAGNHSKHNISRLTGVSKKIHKVLAEHNYDVPLEVIPLALEDFQEHLSENYFIYYGTWMVQLLNDVRWGIQRYLEPMYSACYKQGDDGGSYQYEYPLDLHSEVAKQWFWRLMNHIRSNPYVNKFSAPYYLKGQSSLERGASDYV
ncbi:hypothetical protein [Marinomonas aquiplantarum]|uniref:Uncharacterized protein n=1 Tax=Marinomonas aquiplantarum TaxID=491951 RepID=A0A366CXT0_9GAMM|nr:hypothetical protein [Marinomonas aquiplantarum]RBO82647.1 hypothetical protein DFP76_105112 [Marinomonas aquiplantarum]